jgi:hypothetical protein
MNFTGNTITSMLFGAIRKMWKGEYDEFTKTEGICWHNVLIANSGEFDFDLKDLWLREARYTRLTRQYLDVAAVHRFLHTARAIALGDTKEGAVCAMQAKPVAPKNGAHTLGNCILGFCYSGRRNSPVFTMHSRTAYLSYIGVLDLVLAHALMQEIARRCEMTVQQFRLVWLSTSLQFHTLKSLPLLLNTRLLSGSPRNELQKQTLSWHHKFQSNSLNGEAKYGPVRRVQAVYARNASNRPYPSLPITSLGLKP